MYYVCSFEDEVFVLPDLILIRKVNWQEFMLGFENGIFATEGREWKKLIKNFEIKSSEFKAPVTNFNWLKVVDNFRSGIFSEDWQRLFSSFMTIKKDNSYFAQFFTEPNSEPNIGSVCDLRLEQRQRLQLIVCFEDGEE